jgi:hypothetical protein
VVLELVLVGTDATNFVVVRHRGERWGGGRLEAARVSPIG